MNSKSSKCHDFNRIEFIVTYQCGGRCKHCQIGDDINKGTSQRHVLADKAIEAIEKLSDTFYITSVMTFGGEPLYYPEVTAAIHKKATDCGVKTRQLITNGYFTNSAEKSRYVADLLLSAGVNNLLLSVDSFHQERIPIEPVYRFAKDISYVKIPEAYIYPSWLVNEQHSNHYNDKTKEILTRFNDLPIPVKRGNNIFLMGNAEKFLTDYYEKPEQDSDPFWDLPPSINIEPNGDIFIGDISGNIYKEDISDIINRYIIK